MASKQTITIILWVLIAVFLAGIVFLNVPNSNQPKPVGNYRDGKVLVTINGESLDANTFEQAFNDSLMRANKTPDLSETLQERSRIVKYMVQNMVADQVLRGYGIRNVKKQGAAMADEIATMFLDSVRKATQQQADADLANAKTPEEKNNVRTAKEYFDEQLAQMYMQQGAQPPAKITEEGFRKFYIETLTDPKYGQAEDFMLYVRKRLVGQQIVKRDLRSDLFSDAFAKRVATQQVNARWIFIPAGSMENIGESTEQIFKPQFTAEALQAAEKKARTLREQIVKDPASFAKVASKESQHISRTEGGNLGWISGSSMQANIPAILEYLIFNQKPNELGPVTQITLPGPDPMNTLSAQVGYGFVQVIAETKNPDSPEWATMKEDFVTTMKRRYEMQLGDGYLCYMIANAEFKFNSKEIEAYMAEAHGQYVEMTKLQKEALSEKDLPKPVVAALSFRVAMSSRDIKGEARIPLLKAALEYAGGSRSDLHMQLADTYLGIKDRENAIKQYENAMNSAGMGEENVRRAVRAIYVRIGHTEGVKAIDQWLQENAKKSEEK
ncbi:MAG: peptidylprolyl isomerase [Armatimonadota bacterium]